MKSAKYSILRRSFSQINSSTLLKSRKKNESDELRNTINYLIQYSSEKNLPNFRRYNKNNGENDFQHIERISSLLNKSLPEVKQQSKIIEQHYDVLFSQLKNLVEKSISVKNENKSTFDNKSKHLQLYDELMLLKFNNKNSVSRTTLILKILLNKDFTLYSDVWNNINFFEDKLDRVTISLLLFYKTHNQQIYDVFFEDWLDHYSLLNIPIKRIFWRCASMKEESLSISKLLDILTMEKSMILKSSDIIIIYQSLYKRAYQLLDDDMFSIYCTDQITINQSLFIHVLTILSKYSQQDYKQGIEDIYLPKAKDWLTDIVKLSIENKLCSEINKTTKEPLSQSKIQNHFNNIQGSKSNSGISIYKYKFIRALDIKVKEIYGFCETKKDNQKYMQLLNDLDSIMGSLIEKEKEVKSQMSIKFI